MLNQIARVERLEQLIIDLCLALARQDTALDGNWGWPRSLEEYNRIAEELRHIENICRNK